MRAKTIILGSFLACGMAYGGVIATHLVASVPDGLAEFPSESVRSADRARFQPQDGKITVQARHTRDSPVLQGAVAERASCPRCVIGE